jgi:hypothetical protein
MKNHSHFLGFCVLAFTLVSGPTKADPGSEISFQQGLKIMRVGERQAAFVQKFAEIASRGDEDELFKLIWPMTQKDFGEAEWHKYLSGKIIPYFKTYKSVDGYKNISPMSLLGSEALVHFGYFKDESGKRNPYEMVVVESEGGPFLANIYVGRCVKGQHPVCE